MWQLPALWSDLFGDPLRDELRNDDPRVGDFRIGEPPWEEPPTACERRRRGLPELEAFLNDYWLAYGNVNLS